MQIQLEKLYTIKSECKEKCSNFSLDLDAKYIRFLSNYEYYEILDKNKKTLKYCNCFTSNDLELVERNLYTLEIGDKLKAKNCLLVVGFIQSSSENPLYVFFNDYLDVYFVKSAKQLEKDGYIIIRSEPTEDVVEMTVKEVNDLINKGELQLLKRSIEHLLEEINEIKQKVFKRC